MTEGNLREISSRCEAKLHAFRRTQDGVVVSFVIHPAEVPPVLALDPLGTRYMLAFVAIGDDEQPLPASPHPVGERPVASHDPPPDSGGASHTEKSERAKAAYRDMTTGEQAVCRAAMLCSDKRFLRWAAEAFRKVSPERYASLVGAEESMAAEYIRDRCCGGNSRKSIAQVPEYMDQFQQMLTEFQIAVGELPEPR